MVCRPVAQDHGVQPPARPLPVQLLDQMPEIHFHDLGVGVPMKNAEIIPSFTVDGGDHRNSWSHQHLGDGVGGVFCPPLHSSVVGHIEVGLIHIEDDLFLSHLLEQQQGELLAEHQVAVRVRVERHVFDLLEAHVKAVLHHRSDLRGLDFYLPL